VVSSGGGTTLTLHGRGFPSSALATVCRLGTTGPVSASQVAPTALVCVTPAHAPAPGGTPVYGPVVGGDSGGGGGGSAGGAPHVVRVLSGAAAAVATPDVLPARTAAATSAADVSAAGGGGSGGPTQRSLFVLPVGAVHLSAWFAPGPRSTEMWCVFDASQALEGVDASPAVSSKPKP